MARVEIIPELYNTTLWEFKAEGNANIILSYVGENIRFSATVLRLRKETEFDTTINSQYFTNSYINYAMKPLLGSKYVGESILLEVQPEFLKALSKAILKMRSNKRTQKDIDPNQHYAMLIPDYTKFSNNNPTLSIEFKPKWAFLPSSPFIENSVKLQSCHFCMHKYLKRSSANEITRYCPLDLFSLEDKRVRKAVEALLACPESYLKLFIQGMQIEIGKENWQSWLYEFFEVDYSESNDEEHKNTHVIDMLIALLIQAIMEERDLFRSLKMLQKTLDELDIEGINKLIIFHRPKLSEPSLEEWKLIVDEYMKRIAINNTKNDNARQFVITNMDKMDNKQILQRIYEYLMSATLKDCSIIFSFQKSNGTNTQDVTQQKPHISPIFQNNEGLQQLSLSETLSPTIYKYPYNDKLYVYKVNVIDLDPKPLAKLSYYQELDKKIVRNYLKCGATNKCSE
ncbi:inositol-pentakisphosphate 2-kinase [Glomus cerebriforme]|uniref:Inositol-pentakisphosphate 2-kinase n=1 Tax=Glomus cerebriforme TaxID=658196 RepID=A0A397T3J5_9GLOM|nr:inositol-pentakisphosphate 2-kinase [Glomus cerebriforme]